MALGDILSDIASIGGIKLDSQDQLTLTTMRVNKAAKELYEQNQLIGCLREQVMQATCPQGDQFTMPNYVGTVQAVRYYFPELNLRTVDMRPRYVGRFWQYHNFLSWRLKQQIPTKMDIRNASVVTPTLRGVETVPVTITLIGTTGQAEQCIENLVIPAGQLAVQSKNSYTEFSAITKSCTTANNVDVFDIDSNILSTIPNNQLKALYQLVQIINLPNKNYSSITVFQPVTDYVEVLWKLRWKPMATPQDEFICPGYDAAIFWKYMEHKARLTPQSYFDANQADKFKAKCEEIMSDIARQNDDDIEKFLNFGTNATIEAFDKISQNHILNYYPTNWPSSGCSMVWP